MDRLAEAASIVIQRFGSSAAGVGEVDAEHRRDLPHLCEPGLVPFGVCTGCEVATGRLAFNRRDTLTSADLIMFKAKGNAMKSTRIVTFVAALLAGSVANAATYREVEVDRQHVKAVVTVDKEEVVAIEATISITTNAGDGGTTVFAIRVDGVECARKTFGWHNNLATFPLGCSVTLKPGAHGVQAIEITNSNATAQGVTLRVSSAMVSIPDSVVF